jgi:hypothetical protein
VGSASDGGKSLWGSPLSLSDLVGEFGGGCRVSVFSACLAQSLAENPLGGWGSYFCDNSIYSVIFFSSLLPLLSAGSESTTPEFSSEGSTHHGAACSCDQGVQPHLAAELLCLNFSERHQQAM